MRSALSAAGLLAFVVFAGCSSAQPGSPATLAANASSPTASFPQGRVVRSNTSGKGAAYFAEACARPSGLRQAHCHALVATDAVGNDVLAATPAGFGPGDLRSAYSLPSSGGAGQTVAIVDAYDNPNAEADLAAYRAQYGIAACTSASGCFRKISQTGATSPLPAGNSSWGIEIDLDIEMVSAACPDCKIVLVEASSASYSDLLVAEATAVNQGATYISNSWGGPEYAGEQSTDASSFNHSGVSIFASTGDSGFGGGVEYPSSSLYVTAVGGTTLERASVARGWSETAWSGAGSGCSQYIAKPGWQKDTGCAMRTVGDVAAVADPSTGVAIYDSYGDAGWLTVGGTSVASPLVAAANAVTGVLHGPALSYYDPSAFHDVVAGSSGTCGTYLCNAESGYDGPTGNGTPNGAVAAGRNYIYHDWQTTAGGAWGGETYLGGLALQIAVAKNQDGRLEIFYVGTNNAIYHDWQTTAGGGWSGEVALGGSAKQIAVAKNTDGRLEVFYVGTNNAIYHNWQTTAGGGWSGEVALGGSANQLTVGQNQDGRLEVFYVGTNSALYHDYQLTAGGGWSGEVGLGGAAKQVVVNKNKDGRLEVFYVGTNNAIYHNWQVTAGGGWSGEVALGGSANQIDVAANADGRLEVFYVGTNDVVYHDWQVTAGGGWSGESSLGGTATQLAIGSNADGRLELFYVGTNSVVYHDWQVSPGAGWSGQAPLGERASQVTVSENQDGRLEVFYRGE